MAVFKREKWGLKCNATLSRKPPVQLQEKWRDMVSFRSMCLTCIHKYIFHK